MNKRASFGFCWVIAGCFLGVGFVSGVEINKFFGGCGRWGFIALAISLAVAILTLYRLAVLTKNGKVLFPSKLNKAFAMIRALFMLSLLTYSISSAQEILDCLGVEFNFPWGSLLLSMTIALLCLAKGQSVTTVFSVGVPLIALFCIGYRIVAGAISPIDTDTKSPFEAIIGGIILSAYNVLAGMDAVMRAAKGNVKMGTSAILAGAVLWLSGWGILSSTVNSDSMPMLHRVISDSKALGMVFAVIMLLSLVGTGVSWAVGLGEKLSHKNSALASMAVCAVAFALSLLGFDNITDFIYPVFGAVGVFFVAYINIICCLK